MSNWKTTLAGIAAIFGVAAKLINNPSSISPTDIAAILAGIGLIAAKDHNTQP